MQSHPAASVANTPRFSILLPTLRRKLFEATLHSIYANSKSNNYEIIVVSPFPVKGENIRWIEEKHAGGCIRAFADAYEQSRGDIIVAMTDDTMALPGWLDAIDRWIIEGEKKYMPYCVSLNRVNVPMLGTAYGKHYAYFPAISRRSIQAAGGLFYDPAFVGNWADPDLGMRVWEAGGRVEFCRDSYIFLVTLQAHFSEAAHKTGRYFAKDTELFCRRWGHIAPPELSSTFLRDINVNYSIDMAKDNTILIQPMEKYADSAESVSASEGAVADTHWRKTFKTNGNVAAISGESKGKIAVSDGDRSAENSTINNSKTTKKKRKSIDRNLNLSQLDPSTLPVGSVLDILGFTVLRQSYDDQTSEVVISPDPYMVPMVDSFTKTFATLAEAVAWIVSSLNLAFSDSYDESKPLQKLAIGKDKNICSQLIGMQVAGMNHLHYTRHSIYYNNFFGMPVIEFLIDNQPVYAASTYVNLSSMGLGFLIFSRLRMILLSTNPNEVMYAFLQDAAQRMSNRIGFPLLKIPFMPLGMRLMVYAARAHRLVQKLCAPKNGFLVRLLRRAAWKVRFASWDAATMYRFEVQRLQIHDSNL